MNVNQNTFASGLGNSTDRDGSKPDGPAGLPRLSISGLVFGPLWLCIETRNLLWLLGFFVQPLVSLYALFFGWRTLWKSGRHESVEKLVASQRAWSVCAWAVVVVWSLFQIVGLAGLWYQLSAKP